MWEIVLCPHDRNGTRRIRSDTVFIVKHIFIEAVGVLGQTYHNPRGGRTFVILFDTNP